MIPLLPLAAPLLFAACVSTAPLATTPSTASTHAVVDVSPGFPFLPMVDEYALVPPGTTLHAEAKPGGPPVLTVAGHQPLVVRVQAVTKTRAVVTPIADGFDHCGQTLEGWGWAELRLTVALDELAYVARGSARKAYEDGTWIEIEAGTWLDTAAGRSALAPIGPGQKRVPLPIDLAGSDVGRSYALSTAPEEPPAEQTDSDDELRRLHEAAAPELGGRVLSLPTGTVVRVHQRTEHGWEVTVGGHCAQAKLRVRRLEPVAPAKSRGEEGQMGGARPTQAGLRYRARFGSEISLPGGDVIGRVAIGYRFSRGQKVGNRICTAPLGSAGWFAHQTPACFGAEDVMENGGGWADGPLVLPGAPRVQGSLPGEAAEIALRPHLAEFQDCYQAAVYEGVKARLNAEFDVTTKGTGEVTDFAVRGVPHQPAFLRSCFASILEELRFPLGSNATVSYPLTFEP